MMMLARFTAILAFSFSTRAVRSQVLFNPSKSVFASAVTFTPAFTDAFSCSSHPAALAHMKGIAAAAYAEKKFMTGGLNLMQLSVNLSDSNSGAGIFLKYFGNPSFHETEGAVNYGKRLGDVRIGISLRYNAYKADGYVKWQNFCLAFSSIYKLSENVYTAIYMVNPAFVRLKKTGTTSPSEYVVAFCYEPSQQVCLALSLAKQENAAMQANVFLRYQTSDRTEISGGFYTNGPQPFVALTWRSNNMKVAAAISFHPTLGPSPGFFIYRP